MKSGLIKRILWIVCAIIVLFLSYYICRVLLFEIHGMNQFPTFLFVFGLATLLISLFAFSRKVVICVALGYIVSFTFAMLFNADVYQNESLYNNAWIIWSISYLLIIVLGIVIELSTRRIQKKQIDKNCQ